MTKIGRNQLCPCGSGKKYKTCCLNRPKSGLQPGTKHDELDAFMGKGWSLLQKNETTKACDVWLELWDGLKERFKPEFTNIQEAESIFSGSEFIFNWCQDLESELGNAGIDDSAYYQKRIAYCDEFCSLFPASDKLVMHNMKRAIAESYFALGNIDEGNRRFNELIEQYPDNIWGYIGWGDMFLRPIKKIIKPDYDRAEKIYTMALGRGMEGEQELLNRLDELEKAREKDIRPV